MAVCEFLSPRLEAHMTVHFQPERIKGESKNEEMAYTVSSDVWSLGLSLIELAMGAFPYPPETYANVFAQLTAIIHGDPPTLPDGFSDQANDFVSKWYGALALRNCDN